MKIHQVISHNRKDTAREVLGEVEGRPARTFHVQKHGPDWHYCVRKTRVMNTETKRYEDRIETAKV